MNKQDLIEKYQQIYEVSNNTDFGLDPFSRGEDAGSSRCSFEIVEDLKKLDEPTKVIAHLAEKWHEDIGPVLWWDFPVEEPPYCGTPLDDDFPKYKTHFTELHIPDEVEEEPKWVLKHQNGMYFTRFNEEMKPLLGGEKRAYRFTDESKAEALTIFFNGTVEKV